MKTHHSADAQSCGLSNIVQNCLIYMRLLHFGRIQKDPKTLNVFCLSVDPLETILTLHTVKPVLSGHSERRPKCVFKTDYR